MQLPKEAIQKFQALYKNRFGKEISEDEAYDKGAKLLQLMTLVYHPMTREQLEAVQARRKELFGNKDP
jgi:hypothetical protein